MERPMKHLATLWGRLTAVADSVSDPERRRQLQLLCGLLVVLMPLCLISIVVELWLFPGFFPTFLALSATLLVFAVAYGLARAGFYLAGALVLITITAVACFAIVILNPADAVTYAFLYLSMFLAHLLFGAPGVWITTTVNLIGVVVVLPLLNVPPPGNDPVVVPIFLIITAALLQLAIRYRDLVEMDRRSALEHREQDFRAILENMQDTYYQTNHEGRIVRASASVQALLGYTPSELLGRRLGDLYVEAEGRNNFLAALRKTGRLKSYEAALRRKDGSVVWVSTNAQYVRNSDGQPIGVEGTTRDVTERVTAQMKLRESEEMLNKAQAVAHIGSWWWEFSTDRFIGSPELFRIYDIEVAPDARGTEVLEAIDKVIVPEDRQRIRDATRNAVDLARTTDPLEFRIKKRNGTIRTLFSYPELMVDDRGRALYSYGAIQDVTDQRQIEKGLLDIAKAISSATGQTFFSSLVGNIAKILPADMVFIGEPLAEHPNRIRAVAVSDHGHDAAPFEYDLENTPCAAVYDGVPCAHPREVRKSFPDDRLLVDFDIEAYVGIPLFSSNGRALGIMVALYRNPINEPQTHQSMLEIFAARAASELERVRAERALQDSERRYRTIVETAQEGIWAIDDQDRTTFVNQRMAQMLGYSVSEMAGRPLWDFLHPDHHSKASQSMARRRLGVAEQRETAYLRKDGSVVHAHISSTPLRDSAGNYVGAMALVSDLTEQREAKVALRESEENYRLLFENMTSGFALHEIICDESGEAVDYRYLQANPAFERLTGVPVANLIGKRIREILPNTEDYWIKVFGHVALTGEPTAYENFSRELGRYYDTWVFRPRPLQFAVIFTDITERKLAEAEMRKLSSAIEQTADSVLITNRAGEIEYVNPAFEKITGYSRNEAVGQTPRIVKSGKQGVAFYQHLWKTILGGDVYSDVLINRRKDGSQYYEEKTITPLKNAEGEITHFISTGKDVSERMQAQERMEYMAQHDALTELPNRLLLLDRLKQALARARWHNRLVAVLFIDLDRFKNINDSLGHEAGDKLLQQLAARFNWAVREGDTVARFGGDEFVILLDDMADGKDAGMVAQKVLDGLKDQFEIDEHRLFITASIGISLFPADGEDSSILLRHADVAMYRAKELGKNTFQYYSADMSARAFERLSLETRLRHAIDRNEFLLHYQPQVDVDSGKIVGVEALIRWQHPDFGLVYPNDFIPLLEETGLIVVAGEWVLESATTQLAEWHRQGWPGLRMAINLSARQFQGPGLLRAIEAALSRLDQSKEVLELEFTESLLVKHAPSTNELLDTLRERGVRFAIDDFGTGYSSLSYLRRLPIDTIKIDRSFVHDVPDDPDDCAITAAIAALATSLKVEMIAEGVESESQRDYLRALGCRIMQGYLFGRPRPAADLAPLLAEKNPVSR